MNLLFLREPTPGLQRFVVVRNSQCKLFINDLLRIRFYIGDDKFYISLDEFLPMYHDKIEYDVRQDEWFIIREVI